MVQQAHSVECCLPPRCSPPPPISNSDISSIQAGNGNGSSSSNSMNNGTIPANAIQIRPAIAGDTARIRALIQELADHQDMADGPRIGADRLAADLHAGTMHSVVAMDGTEMAAYAIYFLPSSWEDGPIMFLEDLYIRVPYRRKGLGLQMLRELAKIAHAKHLHCMEWDVLRSNPGAIKFYHKLPGLEDLTDGKGKKPAERKIMWRLPSEAFDHVATRANCAKMPLDLEVQLDEAERCGERAAQQLAEQWHQLMAADGQMPKQPHLSTKALAKQLQMGQLGVLVVKSNNNNNAKENSVLAMALFHRKAYSTWTGAFVFLDQLIVRAEYRRNGIGTAMMGELVKVARKMGAVRIQWTAADRPSDNNSICPHVAFFESLNAVNLTDTEGWLLYRWHYRKSTIVPSQ